MRLSKLKLAGFKSFVDPTTVLTPGQLVGIVGPNGCGKSNLIDAVRWVLGETRASALRGESMQDVIFNGSNTRKPVSRASVELVFDNAEGKAAGQWAQYAEIAVKRIVERAGNSDYFINNVRVRRKDVIDLFLGTGLGPRAYAIIEQGMISRVIEARPEEIRAFLEEAAGITKYKERRRETEGRLGDASDNLTRVEDIRAELGQQIGRLADQAELARRYKEIQSGLQTRQVLLWRYRHTVGANELVSVATSLGAISVALEERNAQLVETETQLLLARDALGVFAEAVSVAQGDLYAISAELTRVEGELKRVIETRERLAQRAGQLGNEQESWNQRLQTALEDKNHLNATREDASALLETRIYAAQAAKAALPVAEQAWRDAIAQRDTQQRALAAAEQQIRVADTRRMASLRALEALELRRQRVASDLEALLPVDAEVLPVLEATYVETTERLALAQESQGELELRLHALQQALVAAREQAGRATKEATELQARLAALRNLQSRLRDQGDLAQWLQQYGLADLAPLWQSLRVEAGLELAVEAVLRERIGALGPLDSTTMAALGNLSAPATLVLMHEALPVQAPRSDSSGVPLASFVRCNLSEQANFVANWLFGVDVVEDITPWLDGRQAAPADAMLVTRTGQIYANGALTLFAPDARTHGAIERQREIEELEAALVACEETLAVAKEQVEELEQAHHACQGAGAEARAAVQQLQSVLHAQQLEVLKAQQELARFAERRELLDREDAEIADLVQLEREHLESSEQERLMAEESTLSVRESLEMALAAMKEREEALYNARDQSSHAQQGVQGAEFALRECEAKLEEAARTEHLARTQLEKGNEELARVGGEREGLDENQLQASIQTALDLRRQRETALAARRDEQEEANRRAKALDEARLRLEHELGPLREQLGELKLKQQAAELTVSQALERLGEFGAEAVMLGPNELGEVRETTLNREVQRLSRELADMGAVNLAALQELETASARKHFLDVQYEDLSCAIGTLQDAIKRIDRDTREQLLATYETVNRHFGELFPRLFGGGEAQLILSGDEILDAGVQIVARPPGKKNSSIHLLSGGEKALTAIALVFAMFQLNPAPFCMLDEVDAPLDDANTERYCEMVKHMSSSTQFVFISHSKITMEMARQLVGVTMQERGVSRVVEVDIDAAIKLAQPAAT